MANLTNPAYSSTTAAYFGNANTIKVIDSKVIAVGTANLVLNDLITAFRARKGFCVTGVVLKADDLDTGGSPAVALKVGDADDDDRFVAASNIAQAGGATATLAAAGAGYIFPADTDVIIKVSTAPATAAAGTVRLMLLGFETEV